MSGGPFDDLGETLFADKGVLKEDYQPTRILERDDEIEQYRYALRDVLFGRAPQNVMVYGKAGLGKTAVTTHMLNALHEKAQEREEADELHIHELNCNGKTTFAAVRRLVNELLPSEASEFPKRGLGINDAFEELYEQLDRIGGTHLLVFDEIDHLDDANMLLYEIPRARSIGHITQARVGIIGISNSYTFRKSLTPKVKDTLMETEISFSAYDADELAAILRERAEKAFIDGAYDGSAIAWASAVSARDMGNARQAIDLLRVGAEVAEKAGEEQVAERHLKEARELVQRGRLSNRIRDQTRHTQYILETIARLQKRDETPARSKAIQAHYEQVAASHGSDPLTTLKSVQDHLSDLHMLGFLTREDRNFGMSGGQYYEYELDMDVELVIETREQIEAEE